MWDIVWMCGCLCVFSQADLSANTECGDKTSFSQADSKQSSLLTQYVKWILLECLWVYIMCICVEDLDCNYYKLLLISSAPCLPAIDCCLIGLFYFLQWLLSGSECQGMEKRALRINRDRSKHLHSCFFSEMSSVLSVRGTFVLFVIFASS